MRQHELYTRSKWSWMKCFWDLALLITCHIIPSILGFISPLCSSVQYRWNRWTSSAKNNSAPSQTFLVSTPLVFLGFIQRRNPTQGVLHLNKEYKIILFIWKDDDFVTLNVPLSQILQIIQAYRFFLQKVLSSLLQFLSSSPVATSVSILSSMTKYFKLGIKQKIGRADMFRQFDLKKSHH